MKEIGPGEIIAALNALEESIVASQRNATKLSGLLERFAEQNGVKIHDSHQVRECMGHVHSHLGGALSDAVCAHRGIAHIGEKMGIALPRTGGGGK